MKLLPVSTYVHQLRPVLPPRVFARTPWRLIWLPVHAAIIAACATAILTPSVPRALLPLWSLVLGTSLACLTFLAHEVLHGAVVKPKWLQLPVGYLGFWHFMLSPRLWVAWHNRVHHAYTQQPGVDPDAYPMLKDYQRSRLTRIGIDWLALGGNRLRGLFTLALGFSTQCALILVAARKRGYLDRRQHLLAIAETLTALASWVALAVVVGPRAFAWLFVLPVLVANALVMAFILSNHCLSPLTTLNDPLVNALSVTAARPFEWWTLQFGYHVEHHLFPSMSMRFAPLVRTQLKERWPERYQSMPLWKAVATLYRTARVYKDATTLIDPRTGAEWKTLLPRTAPEGERVTPLSAG